MKKWIPLLIFLPFALWAASALRAPKDKPDTFAIQEFGRLPVLTTGRIQPIDSLARNSLLQLREKQTANTAPWESRPKMLSAAEWALEMMTNQPVADTRPVFRIDHPELKSLLSLPEENKAAQSDGKHYTWKQISPKLEDLQTESRRVTAIDASKRTRFDQAVVKLWNGVAVYMRMQNTLQPLNAKDWPKELAAYQENVGPGVAAARAQQAGQTYDKAAFERIMDDLQRFDTMTQMESAMIIPPADPAANPMDWRRTGAALMEVARGGTAPYALTAFARMSGAFKNGQVAFFNQAVADYRAALQPTFSEQLKKCANEQFFNAFAPFVKAMSIYIFAALCILFYWFNPLQFEVVRRGAFWLVMLAFAIHTGGLLFRMLHEGRPPVTNLYSSAIFIGLAACLLGICVELFWKNAIGLMIASVVGFITLIIAHHLALSGDTMEMMRAVLDSNFWLATHVVAITLGYAATFAAGICAILFIFLGVFTKVLTVDVSKAFSKIVYAIICFAILFSFVGTVLGGIWADQSWGRFWGWDPKENGALIIVLWNAIVLHARWGGLVKERGLMNLVIGGNIVTAWSWFGVNMLGIGLHSYGFTDAAFLWLSGFGISQIVIICIGLLPRSIWRSASATSTPAAAPLPA